MSKFDELKKAAEAAIEREDCDRFIQRDDAQSVLELLDIQAQLVEALSHPALYELLGNVEDSLDGATWAKAEIFMEARDAALFEAGKQS